MTAHGCVTLDKDGAIARVALNRPAQMNAISPELLEGLWPPATRSSATRA